MHNNMANLRKSQGFQRGSRFPRTLKCTKPNGICNDFLCCIMAMRLSTFQNYENHVVYRNQVSAHAQTNSLCVARAETEFYITKAGSARNMFASRAQKEHFTPRGEYIFCACTNVYISERGNTVFASRTQNIVFTSRAKYSFARVRK